MTNDEHGRRDSSDDSRRVGGRRGDDPSTRHRHDGRGVWLLAMLGAFVFVGCGSDGEGDPLALSESQEEEIVEVCTSGGGLDFAVAPTPTGPNKIAVAAGRNDSLIGATEWTTGVPNYMLEPDPPLHIERSRNDIAYVACFEEIEGTRTVSHTCFYSDVYTVTYFDVDYTLSVREAATGSVVDDVELSSVTDGECPGVVGTADELSEPTELERPNRPDVRDVKPFLDAWTTPEG